MYTCITSIHVYMYTVSLLEIPYTCIPPRTLWAIKVLKYSTAQSALYSVVQLGDGMVSEGIPIP